MSVIDQNAASQHIPTYSEVKRNMNRITINLNEEEEKLKDMIRSLKETKAKSNPYSNRSESVIAKMILQPALEEEYKKYVKATR